jgi:hypothetical protein
MARSDSASKRLSRVIKEIPIPDRSVGITDAGSGKIVHVYKWEEVPTSLIASLLRDLVTLTSEDPLDASLAQAFAVANLNPANPVHWRMLLHFFAWAHYGDRRGRGAPRQWDSLRLTELRKDFNEIKSRHLNFSDESVLRLLAKKPAYRTQGKALSTNRLRKLLKAANDPKHNELLAASRRSMASPPTILKNP